MTEEHLETTPSGELTLPALGKVLAGSGYFKDAVRQSQAIAKVLAGREIGIPPVAAVRSIHIVEGKVELSATLIAALIRRHAHYDYRVLAMSDEAVEVEIVRDGAPVGRSRFTLEDARRAGLVKERGAWQKYPRNMLFARAISNAARWFAPDVFSGEVYAEGEIGEVVEGEVVAEAAAPPAEAVPEQPQGEDVVMAHPWGGETPVPAPPAVRNPAARAAVDDAIVRFGIDPETLARGLQSHYGLAELDDLADDQLVDLLGRLERAARSAKAGVR